MKSIQKIITGLIVILGLVHIGFTFRDYDGLSMNAMWFAGAGFAIVFAGFLNVAMLRHGRRDRVIWAMCLVANVVLLLMFGAAAYVLRQPQAYIGVFLFMFTTIFTFFDDSEKNG